MCAPIYGSSNQTSKNHYSVIGQLTPLHSNAGGKAILSVLPDDRIDEILRDNRLQSSTEHTITSETRLRDEIEIIRDRGYAISEGEAVSGVNAIAAPIAVADEIGAVGFHSFDGAKHDDLSVFSEDVLEKAAEISISLQS